MSKDVQRPFEAFDSGSFAKMTQDDHDRVACRRNCWHDHHVCAMDCVTCYCKKLYCLNNSEYVYHLNSQQYSATTFQEHFNCLPHRYSSQNRQGPPSESVTILSLGRALLAFSGFCRLEQPEALTDSRNSRQLSLHRCALP